MESHLHEWLHLLLRWIHFIVGVAWIGASFYFNWLENRLNRAPPQEDGIAGHLWAVHGGGFYHLRKFQVGPRQLPRELHWFKWEAYTTWLSGVALLIVVYYFNAHTFLLRGDGVLTAVQAIAVGIVCVIGSWFAYDALCKSPLRRRPVWLAGAVFIMLAALAWLLSELFSGRAAYIHVGAAIGTMMVGNVFFVIIPAQKEMVTALQEGRAPDPKYGANGLLRSRHNNYLTLPVLFIMISAHFPATYGHAWSWAVLAGVAVAGWLARHYFNVRHLHGAAAVWLLPAGFAILVMLAWWTAPRPPADASASPPATAEIMPVIAARCTGCHAVTPSQVGFSAPPAGLVLQSESDVEANAERIFTATVTSKTMPIGNLTQMTDAERELVAAWYYAFDASAK